MTTYIVVDDATGHVLRVEKGNHKKEKVGVRDGQTVYTDRDTTIPKGAGNMIYDPVSDSFSPKPTRQKPGVAEFQAARDKNDTKGMLDALYEMYTGEKP